MSWRRLENVSKTSSRCMVKTSILVLTKTSSDDVRLKRTHSSWLRRLEDVFKTSSEDEDERRLQDVLPRRLHQDECLLCSCYWWKQRKIANIKKIWRKIRYLIRLITNNSNNYGERFMKAKFTFGIWYSSKQHAESLKYFKSC